MRASLAALAILTLAILAGIATQTAAGVHSLINVPPGGGGSICFAYLGTENVPGNEGFKFIPYNGNGEASTINNFTVAINFPTSLSPLSSNYSAATGIFIEVANSTTNRTAFFLIYYNPKTGQNYIGLPNGSVVSYSKYAGTTMYVLFVENNGKLSILYKDPATGFEMTETTSLYSPIYAVVWLVLVSTSEGLIPPYSSFPLSAKVWITTSVSATHIGYYIYDDTNTYQSPIGAFLLYDNEISLTPVGAYGSSTNPNIITYEASLEISYEASLG